MSLKKNILFISGPTTSGKSKLAIKIAKKIGGEIINADSMQIYKELKIITARPSKEEQSGIPHHLFGHKSGGKRYNVYNWCKESSEIIKKIIKNKKIPIVVGGTGLYFNSFIKGIVNVPAIPERMKKESFAKLKRIGANNFFSEIKKFDSESTSSIKKNDLQRMKRIWEVFMYTGTPLSEWQEKKNINFLNNNNYNLILILPERKKLYDNCNSRFLKMIEKGAVEEVKKLQKQKFDNNLPIMKAHGVPELIKYIEGKISIEQAIVRAQQATRRYVKRQFTWWEGSSLRPCMVFEYFPSNIDLNSVEILKKCTN